MSSLLYVVRFSFAPDFVLLLICLYSLYRSHCAVFPEDGLDVIKTS